MTKLLTCSHGHQWEISPADPLPADPGLTCPVCSGLDDLPPPPGREGDEVQALRARTPMDAPSVPEGPDALPQVPGYEILSMLGRGGMGVVYRAWQKSLKRTVALKMILAGPHAGPQQRLRFRTEAEAVAQLQHPNIVQIFEVGEHDGLPYCALEYVAGGSLAQKLAGTPLPARTAAAVVEVLARAVHAAHQRGIIHRDLNPANVLLQAPQAHQAQGLPSLGLDLGVPKITDFGLAKYVGEVQGGSGRAPDGISAGNPEIRTLPAGPALTHTGAILGTPSYMAPEQAEGQGNALGPAADVYALGAILYECLTGRPPFKGASLLDTLQQVRTGEVVAPGRLRPELPRDLETVCLKCLEKHANKRYASALQLADDLGAFLRGDPVQARRPTRWEQLRRWARRRPVAGTLVASAVLAAVALAVGALWHVHALGVEVQRAAEGEKAARTQRERADVNYRRARDTIRRMYGLLTDRRLAEVPRLRELKEKELEEALAFYRGTFEDLEDPDPEVRLDVATAHGETGFIQDQLGRREPAEDNYRRALALLEGLAKERPDLAEVRVEQAKCSDNLGQLLTGEPKRVGEAVACHRRALALWDELIDGHPDVARWQHERVLSYLGLGNAHRASHEAIKKGAKDREEHWNQAEAAYLRAQEFGARLVDAHRNVTEYASTLAKVYIEVGHIDQWSGRAPQAEALYRKAEPLLKNLLEQNPHEPDYALPLAILYNNWGNIQLYQIHDDKRALELFSNGVRLAGSILEQEPRLGQARSCLIFGHGGRAYALANLGRHAESVRDWDRVVALLEDGPDRDFRRSERAVELAKAGDHAGAAAEARALSGREGDLRIQYNAACTFVVCANQVKRDARLPSKEQARLVEEYASRAAALWMLARKDPALEAELRKDLRSDPDVAPLRDRADFQALQRAIEEKKGEK